MNLARNNRKSWQQLLAGWGALLLYVAAASPVGLCLATIASVFDSTHQVIVAAGEHGGRLVLHHGSACLQHHHGATARVLTIFASPPSSSDPDHVLQCTSVDSLKGQEEATTHKALAEAQLAHSDFAPHDLHGCPSLRAQDSSHAPPEVSGALRNSRTTLLLI